jgi:hypothetical protein
MVDLLLAGDEERIRKRRVVLTVCDPCCGSGGMLTITKDHITVGVRKNSEVVRAPINPDADIHLFGQEVNPGTFAVVKSDIFMKSTDGRDAETFSEREVKPHVPDPWIDTTKRDEKDGQIGIVGYEMNFNRYFCKYIPPRRLEEIESDIRAIEKDIIRMLAKVTGSTPAGK